MKVAMITPYFKEKLDYLIECRNSVRYQTYKDVTHIFVGDGYPNSLVESWKGEHIAFQVSHDDAGATPRAIAAISAFSRGYDAVGFIDADNWIDEDHVEQMVNCIKESQAQFVIATRRIHCGIDKRELYVDLVESNGENMVDTNSMFFTRDCLHLLTYWVTEPKYKLWSDRAFWNAVKSSGVKIAKCTKPTVAYATKWAWHYKHAGATIPPDSVWISHDENGNIVHIKHKDSKEYNES